MAGKCLAVITARGGSKRIPRKNIKLFAVSLLLRIRSRRRKRAVYLMRSWFLQRMRKLLR